MGATGVVGGDPHKLDTAGGTMTGALVLDDGSPAASEHYVATHGGAGGGGSVSSVAGVDPGDDGDVPLTPADIGAALASDLAALADGLGTAAAQDSTAFDASGAASTALSTALSAITSAINALGLGSASTHAAGDFDASGAASTAQAYAVQRSHHTGTQTMSTISDAGGAATKDVGTSTGTVAAGDDSRFTDMRTPTDNSVTSAKIADGAIVNADINSGAAIALSKLASDPLARANHTGTQTASTISDFTSAVNALYSSFADVASLGTNVAQGTPHLQSRTEPGSIVRLQGQIAFTGTATGTLFTLPAGQRPAAQVMIEQRTQVTAVQVILLINTDGTVTTGASIGATALVNFDDVTFVHA